VLGGFHLKLIVLRKMINNVKIIDIFFKMWYFGCEIEEKIMQKLSVLSWF